MKTKEETLLELGVRKLRSFGFVNATVNNVLTDEVYRFYFIRFMQKHREENSHINVFLNNLIEYAKAKNKPTDLHCD